MKSVWLKCCDINQSIISWNKINNKIIVKYVSPL